MEPFAGSRQGRQYPGEKTERLGVSRRVHDVMSSACFGAAGDVDTQGAMLLREPDGLAQRDDRVLVSVNDEDGRHRRMCMSGETRQTSQPVIIGFDREKVCEKPPAGFQTDVFRGRLRGHDPDRTVGTTAGGGLRTGADGETVPPVAMRAQR